MTFYSMMNESFTMGQQLELLARVVVAILCGVAVGFERTRRLKEAGIRTHCVVACAAALLMIVSKYGFADLALNGQTDFMGSRGADPSRIAAQIVSGIGFLGAGLIFRNGLTVKGLTTAAGVWATAAVGMAVGAGLYFIGLFTVLIIVAMQFILHRRTVGGDAYCTQRLVVVFYDSEGVHRALETLLGHMEAQILESDIERREDGPATYRLTVRSRHPLDFQTMNTFLSNHPEIQRFSV